MKTLFSAILLTAVFFGCSKQPEKKPVIDAAKEKSAIESVIKDFYSNYTSKNLAGLMKHFASDNVFLYGTDSAEVNKNRGDIGNQFKNDFMLFKEVKLGDYKNMMTVVDPDGEMGTSIYELPFVMTLSDGTPASLNFRFMLSFKKENGVWKILHGIVSAPTVGQSSAVMVKMMQEQKNKK